MRLIRRIDLKYLCKYAYITKFSRNIRKIKTVAILYNIPQNSKKKDQWHDGFTAAVQLLSKDYTIVWINVSENNFFESYDPKKLNQFDFILTKSVWRDKIDLFLRKNAKTITTPLGMMISGSLRKPLVKEMNFYDTVWYETEWYFINKKINRHPNAYHGFGIDTSIMNNDHSIKKKYDWILVGAPKKYKRVHKLIDKLGKKLFIGDLTNNDNYSKKTLLSLQKNGIELKDFVSYSELAFLYNSSKSCLVPTKLHGGGERSVLEARACQLPVEIANDNPKLKELLTSDIWDHNYYYTQLKKGIQSIEHE